MLMFQLAEALHKSVAEIESLSWEEIAGWVAYFKIRKQDSKNDNRTRRR